MNSPQNLQLILETHLPSLAVSYCMKLWQETPFAFHVKRPRNSKLGDFRYRKGQKYQTITINSDLNPFQFLLTFIHEVAHLRTFEKLGVHHSPHGTEWKAMFQALMEPVLYESVFPKDILIPLKLHMRNPSASSAKDLFLMKEISKYDHFEKKKDSIFLSDIRQGIEFELAGRCFKKLETRRTRVLCEETSTGKRYLIALMAKVKPLE